VPHTLFPTTFGPCGIAWNEIGLTGMQLPEAEQAQVERKLAQRTHTQPAGATLPPAISQLIERIQQHLEGCLADFSSTPLDWSRVTDFQQAVYLQTQRIKPGYKTSYGEIAKSMALGNSSARAVGVALATNPWPLIVPCHRVVSAGDKMTGFSGSGGIRTKTRLLALEGAELLSE